MFASKLNRQENEQPTETDPSCFRTDTSDVLGMAEAHCAVKTQHGARETDQLVEDWTDTQSATQRNKQIFIQKITTMTLFSLFFFLLLCYKLL